MKRNWRRASRFAASYNYQLFNSPKVCEGALKPQNLSCRGQLSGAAQQGEVFFTPRPARGATAPSAGMSPGNNGRSGRVYLTSTFFPSRKTVMLTLEPTSVS